MANSPTEIANFALSMLGAHRIMTIDDTGDKKARTAKIHYKQVRQELLRSHRWNFATKRAQLSRQVQTPVYGWAYQYSIPTDFLRLCEVNNANAWGKVKSEHFEIEGGSSGNGLLLLSNAETVRIRYIWDIQDTTQFDPLFTTAFSTLLASRIARAITGSNDLERQLKDQYEAIDLTNATFVDAEETRGNENHPLREAMNRSLFVNARRPYYR